jgi:hypothetical protein
MSVETITQTVRWLTKHATKNSGPRNGMELQQWINEHSGPEQSGPGSTPEAVGNPSQNEKVPHDTVSLSDLMQWIHEHTGPEQSHRLAKNQTGSLPFGSTEAVSLSELMRKRGIFSASPCQSRSMGFFGLTK